MAKRDAVELHVGEEHSVVLEGLMTAGYLWQPEVVGDQSVAEVFKAEDEVQCSTVAVGAGPAEVFTIRALKPGTTTVRFAQRRPWDPAPPAGEHTIDLRVEE